MIVEEDLTFSKDELPEDVSLVIVDDDAPFLHRLSRAMEQRGFDVRTANTVSEGLQLIRESPPAFAVVDMRLDDGNGLDVIAELSRRRADSRAIVLTGYGNIATAVSYRKQGYLPFFGFALLKLVETRYPLPFCFLVKAISPSGPALMTTASPFLSATCNWALQELSQE